MNLISVNALIGRYLFSTKTKAENEKANYEACQCPNRAVSLFYLKHPHSESLR